MLKYLWAVLTSALLALSLAACGGGNGVSGTTLSGTAATGKAIANKSVTVFSQYSGATKTTTTDSNGKFSLDVTGLTPPLLLKINNGSIDLYSIATQAGTVNIHQLSDLIVRNYLATKGLQLDSRALAGLKTSDIAGIELTIRNTIAQQLQDQNINVQSFNLLNTPFDANSTKFDAVLDVLKVNNDVNGEMRIMLVNPNNPGSEGTSVGVFSNSVSLISSPLTVAKDGINLTLKSWKDTVDAKGTNTAPTDLLPLYNDNYLNQGMNATEDINAILSNNFPGQIDVFEVKSIVSVDSVNSIVTATISANSTNWPNKTLPPMSFKYDDSAKKWLFYGDQRIAGITVKLLSSSSVELSVYDTKDQLDSVTVAGPGISVTKALVRDAADPKKFLLSVTITSTSGGFPMGVSAQEGSVSLDTSSVYTFTLTRKTGGDPVTYKVTALSGAGLLDPHGH